MEFDCGLVPFEEVLKELTYELYDDEKLINDKKGLIGHIINKLS